MTKSLNNINIKTFEKLISPKDLLEDIPINNKVKKFIDLGYSVWVFSNELEDGFMQNLVSTGAFISNENFEVDFVRLMFMNEIYGPPSTFSVMASNIAKYKLGLDCSFHYLESE